jgi:hypothetical protein
MHAKIYKMRSVTVEKGKTTSVNLNLEFEGERAFVVLDAITLGGCLVKARVEIDPDLLQKGGGREWDFYYRGSIVLPRPENN